MVVIQYPDTATVSTQFNEIAFVNGVPTPGQDPAKIQIKGRYEPSTLNREVSLNDGSTQKVKGIFYTPISSPDISTDADFEIPGIIKTKVLFFTRGQLNCRVYL